MVEAGRNLQRSSSPAPLLKHAHLEHDCRITSGRVLSISKGDQTANTISYPICASERTFWLTAARLLWPCHFAHLLTCPVAPSALAFCPTPPHPIVLPQAGDLSVASNLGPVLWSLSTRCWQRGTGRTGRTGRATLGISPDCSHSPASESLWLSYLGLGFTNLRGRLFCFFYTQISCFYPKPSRS